MAGPKPARARRDGCTRGRRGRRSSQLLIAVTPSGATLYAGPDTEITRTGTTKTVTNRYSHLGQTVATADNADNPTYLLVDHHNTATLAVSTANTVTSQRRYDPFGNPRGPTASGWPTTRGFLNGSVNATSQLTHLGARDYDPTTGRFITVDPLIDLTDPTQWNPYAYANSSPVSYSDPSGLKLCADSCQTGDTWITNGKDTHLKGGKKKTTSSPPPPSAPDNSTKKKDNFLQGVVDGMGDGVKDIISSLNPDTLYHNLLALKDLSWSDIGSIIWETISHEEEIRGLINDLRAGNYYSAGHALGGILLDASIKLISVIFTGGVGAGATVAKALKDAGKAGRAAADASVVSDTTARLGSHVSQAVADYNSGAIGMSARQARAASRRPGLEPAFRGQVIDKAVKNAVRNDPDLAHLWISEQGYYGPDFVHLESGTWWDITSQAQFQTHLDTYSNFGSGIGLFTH